MKTLARKPERRYQSVEELQHDVAEYQGGVEGALKRQKWLVFTLLFLTASLFGFILNELLGRW